MEKYQKQQQFLVSSVSELTSCLSSSFSKTDPVFARFIVESGSPELRFGQGTESSNAVVFTLKICKLFKLGPAESLCVSEASEGNKEKSYSRGISIQFNNEEESRAFHCAFEQWKKEVVVQERPLINGAVSTSKSKFDYKIEASSAKMYFHYYGQLLHQQNMLQDFVRTGSNG